MNEASRRATVLDRRYLELEAHIPCVPAFEIELAEPVRTEAVRTAATTALRRHPRFASTYDDGAWVTSHAQSTPVLSAAEPGAAGDEQLRGQLIDRGFGATEPSLRLGLSGEGRKLLVAWRHGTCDAGSGVGFVADLLHVLQSPDHPLGAEVPEGPAHRKLAAAAIRPGSLLAFARKAARFRRVRHATFPYELPFRDESDTIVWTVPGTERADLSRQAAAAGGTFTGLLVSALTRACFDLLGPTRPVALLVPVNLRPAQDRAGSPLTRWAPDGNFVGNTDLSFTRAPSVAAASASVETASGPARYAPVLAAGIRRLLPHHGTGGDPRLYRTAVLNNLGAVDADLFPGAVSAAFHGPNAVDYPSLALFTVGDVTTVCVRVRKHQGGGELARELSAAFRRRLAHA